MRLPTPAARCISAAQSWAARATRRGAGGVQLTIRFGRLTAGSRRTRAYGPNPPPPPLADSRRGRRRDWLAACGVGLITALSAQRDKPPGYRAVAMTSLLWLRTSGADGFYSLPRVPRCGKNEVARWRWASVCHALTRCCRPCCTSSTSWITSPSRSTWWCISTRSPESTTTWTPTSSRSSTTSWTPSEWGRGGVCAQVWGRPVISANPVRSSWDFSQSCRFSIVCWAVCFAHVLLMLVNAELHQKSCVPTMLHSPARIHDCAPWFASHAPPKLQ